LPSSDMLYFKLTVNSDLLVVDAEVFSEDFINTESLKKQKVSDILHVDYQSYIPLTLADMKKGDVFTDHLLCGRIGGKYYYLKMTAEYTGRGYVLSFSRSQYLKEPVVSSENENLSLVTENYLGAFYRTDRFGNLIYFSTKIKDMLGYTPSELIGGNLRRDYFLSSKSYDDIKNTMLQTGRLADIEVSLKHKDGYIVWLRVSSVAVYNDKGEYFGSAGYAKDVTEQKSNAEELSHIKNLLALKQKELDLVKTNFKYQIKPLATKGSEAEEATLYHARLSEMGEMVGGIAHQWRQPLSALMFIIEDIRDAYHFGELDVPYLDDSISDCMTYIRYMSDTMDDFRNFFRPEPEKELFNLTEKLIEVVKMQYGRFKIGAVNVDIKSDLSSLNGKNNVILHIEHSIGVKVFYDRPLIDGGVVIYGYPNLLKQVVINLINNSIDSITYKRSKGGLDVSEPGNILITLKVEEEEVSVIIEDNGTGIDEKTLELIFKSDYTTKPKSKGTGIGLHMAKSIIEKSLNGKIKAGNTDLGAVFTITLPRVSQTSK